MVGIESRELLVGVEGGSRSRQERTDISLSALERLGDVAIGEVVDVAQREGQTLLLRETRECNNQRPSHGELFLVVASRFQLSRCRQQPERDLGRSRSLLATDGAADVANRDPVHPGVKGSGVPELWK